MGDFMNIVKKNAEIRHVPAVLFRRNIIPARNTAGAMSVKSIARIFVSAPITAGTSLIQDGAGR
jgi:hypothetical protein